MKKILYPSYKYQRWTFSAHNFEINYLNELDINNPSVHDIMARIIIDSDPRLLLYGRHSIEPIGGQFLGMYSDADIAEFFPNKSIAVTANYILVLPNNVLDYL